MTVPEVADLLGVSLRTVHRMANDKRLPSRRIGRRVLAFDREAIEWIKENRSPRARARRRGQDATDESEAIAS